MLRRFTSQLLHSIVDPLVLRFWHGTQSLMTVKCFQDIYLNLVFQSFCVHVRSWRFRLFFTIFASWLAPFVWMRNALLGLLFLWKTSAWKRLTFASFMYDQTLPSFYWLVLVVYNHLFELVKLKCFHEDFLLLLKLELFLRIWIRKWISYVSWHIIQSSMVGRVEDGQPNCILWGCCPLDSVLLVSAYVDMITWIHVDASIFKS